MNAKSFHFTIQGASHIKKNKECQDASDSFQDENCAIAIVCDGHGGDDYVRSAIGSKLGCAVAMKNIKNFFSGIDKEKFFSSPEKHLKNLEASIIYGWNETIALYHSTNPFCEEELSSVSDKARKKYVEGGRIESAYGTTMIAVAMSTDYWFGIHIGDGRCVAINPEGEFKQPIPWDPKCFLNATTSICDSDAIARFRHFYSVKLPAAVFIGSDGVDDCFSNNEQLHNLYKTVLYSFATSDFQEACDGLADYLPRLSAKGSGDDVSVAALLDMNLIPELAIVREFDREKEKARVEENARKEAERNEAEKRRVEEEHARFQQQNNAKAEKEQVGIVPKFCENCGEGLKFGMKFCSNCGKTIKYRASKGTQPTSPDRLKVIKLPQFDSEPESEEILTGNGKKLIEAEQQEQTADESTEEKDTGIGFSAEEKGAYNINDNSVLEDINSEELNEEDNKTPETEGDAAGEDKDKEVKQDTDI